MAKVRLSKNQLRRQKEKQRKLGDGTSQPSSSAEGPEITKEVKVSEPIKESVPEPLKELVPEESTHEIQKGTKRKLDEEKREESIKEPIKDSKIPEIDTSNPLYQQYSAVFEKFQKRHSGPIKKEVKKPTQELQKHESVSSDEYESDDKETNISKRQLRKQNKVSIARLKALAQDPSVVEASDADAPDPYSLIAIKQNLNVIPVPSHWSAKREYLGGQRGLEKVPFQLPLYILETGIQDMRNSVEDQNLKSSQRERIQPKLGKLDIDYHKLYDAFFKHQSRPRLFPFGDVYYEGRETVEESEEKLTDVKPGKLSQELLKALGLPANGKTAPPWISTMTQLGKPPAYRKLTIPGIDITYANIGYLNGEEEIIIGQQDETWGHMEDAESEEEEEEEQEDLDDQPLADPDIVPYDEGSEEEDAEDSELEKAKNSEPKQLYKVLKDSENDNKVYDLENPSVDSSNDKSDKHEPIQSVDPKKFKF